MKTFLKFTVLSVVLLMLAINAEAQTQQTERQQNGTFSLGARVGISTGLTESRDSWNFWRHIHNRYWHDNVVISLAAPENGTEFGRASISVTLYGNFAFNNNLSLQTEVSFMRHHIYHSSRRFLGNTRLSYRSFDIPLLVKADLFSSSSSSFGFLAGPHILVPIRNVEFYSRRSEDSRVFEEEFSIDNFTVFGLTVGLFSKIPVGPGRIVGDFRFIHDFRSIRIPLEVTYSLGVLPHRRALVFSLGYQLSF